MKTTSSCAQCTTIFIDPSPWVWQGAFQFLASDPDLYEEPSSE